MSVDLFNLVLAAKLTKGGGGGGDIDVDALTVTENGVYSASSGHAYSPVTVSVPTSGITPVGTKDISSNGLYDVTNFSQASVSVPGIVPTGTKNIVENGVYDVTDFASASVSVPATLPSISALTVSENGTYSVPVGVDGFNPVTVNVSGGGGDHDVEDGIIDRTISGVYVNSRVTKIGNDAFKLCSDLTSVNFPNVTIIASSAFYSCYSLTTASFQNVSRIESDAFRACSILASLYILSTSLASLVNSTAFAFTPMSLSSYIGTYGSIYVPASLVSVYQSASRWSVFSSRITAYVEE